MDLTNLSSSKLKLCPEKVLPLTLWLYVLQLATETKAQIV